MSQPSVRSLAVIVSLDLHGYSRLTEQDEIGTHRALMACMRTQLEPIVRQHGGIVVKLTGDGALVRFAHAARALDAMIRFQREVAAAEAGFPESRRLEFRVGIHLASTIQEDGDVFGHGVNLAVRLQEVAEPGSIFLSEAVAVLLDPVARPPLERLGRRPLKNIKEKVDVYCWRPCRREPRCRARHAGTVIAAVLIANVILPTAALNVAEPSDGVVADPTRAPRPAARREDWVESYHGLRGRPLDGGINTTMAAAERSLETRRAIAEDAYLQALALYDRHTPKAFARAIDILDEALKLEPNDGATNALLAALYWGGHQNRWQIGRGMTRADMLHQAQHHLHRAGAGRALALMVRSEMLTTSGRHARALEVAERAIRLEPDQAAGHYAKGSALLFAGRAAEAEAPIRTAIRLDPHASRYLFGLALAQFSMDHFDAAERILAWATAQNSEDDWPHLLMAATQGHLGLRASAQQAIGRFDRLSLTRRGWFASQIPYVYSWPFQRKQDRDRLHAGMVLAGIPEIRR
ncbi:MAG: adenylate/guanylate cyclase domain-containing protein [Alphaproteobacteria bacterium]